MYWDLNVPTAAIAVDQQSHYLAEVARLGIGGIALNVESDMTTAPPSLDDVQPWEIKQSKKTKPQLHGLRIVDGGHALPSALPDGHVRQLKRVTLQCEDMNALRSLNTNKIVQAYDIVAVEALSGRVFQYLCEHADVDLISFDMTCRLPFQLRKPMVDLAIKRGIYFEVKYMQALGGTLRGKVACRLIHFQTRAAGATSSPMPAASSV
ncbi:hypothetical protein, variant [Aphanomyces invadans]|uniref:Uncharacterized protein n=1 Tax=Aphanomyces invadans TaxID=157072 RepID=A0A024UJS7_9STRA|nr:hypothetical protein, variant [Aphanomyces invadans]ETW06127.1 hypothetical protein, variant [Aphanomyces invadans]|eukprot:XP_008865904.1 hypothetical protein, variant [Aphanomyces invadans]